jgi:anhydro-N-acetylmuramic acid kinase
MAEKYNAIGLMSGTSLDGLDIAFCEFKFAGTGQYQLLQSRQIDYDNQRRTTLRDAIHLSASDLLALDAEYGRWLGIHVKSFVEEYALEVDFVASHGHTVHHRPELGYTNQIGAGAALAAASGLPVINDFRSSDVAHGGQGAPLVPIGDQLLFSAYDFCLNLGGIANISFDKDGQRMAYDIGPANMLLNHIANQRGLAYDEGGLLASSGQIDLLLLAHLNSLDFYQQPFPKSLGYEWFMQIVRPIMDQSTLSLEDQMATAVAHISEQIAIAILLECTGPTPASLMVAGGGAKNHFLIQSIQKYLSPKVQVIVPEDELVDYKEAIVFALMGVLRWRNEPNCLASVTGASKDAIGGAIYHA